MHARLILAALAATPCVTLAETTLPPVVVTGSATEKAYADAPASISVITREDLERRPVQELSELLGSVPGVTLSRSGNLVPGVQIRGMASNYTLVLIDGKRVNSTSAVFRGNDYDMGWVPPEEIERIEVVRGPMSSLYGSDAIGGVVNIITRKVGKAWRGSLRYDLIDREDERTGNSEIASFSLSGPIVADTLGVKLSGGYDKRKADDADLNPLVGASRQPGTPKLENRHLSGRVAWTPNKQHDITFDADTARRDHGGVDLDRHSYSLQHVGRFGFGRTELRAYADDTRNQTGTVTGQSNPNKATTRIVDGKVSLPINWLRQTLTLGAESRQEKLTDRANLSGPPGSPARPDPSTEVSQRALFVEDEIGLADDVTLTLGNRFDDHENFGGHNSPRAYLVYQAAKGLTLKAGVGRAFRAPSLLQNTSDWGSVSCNSPTVGCYIIGSRDLKPETSTSKEVGALYDAGTWNASLTVFDNRLKNMIDITNRTADPVLAPTYPNFVGFLPDGRPVFRYQNINSVKTRGVEFSARADLTSAITTRLSYTYTDAKNTSGAIELPLTYRSKHVVNAGVDLKAAPGVTLGAAARLNGRQYISVPANGQNLIAQGSYTILDVTGAWEVNKSLILRAGLLNVGNKTLDRYTALQFNEDGRRIFLSGTARF